MVAAFWLWYMFICALGVAAAIRLETTAAAECAVSTRSAAEEVVAVLHG